MTVNVIRLAFLFVLMVLLQTLLLNNVLFSGYINPYLYLYFILALPFGTPRLVTLIFGFLLGLVIDFFSDSAGIHAAATTFMAYARFHLLNLIKPREGYDTARSPSIRNAGLWWYLAYAGIMVLLHHAVYFSLELFRFNGLSSLLLRILVSSFVTFLLVVLVQFLFGKQRETE